MLYIVVRSILPPLQIDFRPSVTNKAYLLQLQFSCHLLLTQSFKYCNMIIMHKKVAIASPEVLDTLAMLQLQLAVINNEAWAIKHVLTMNQTNSPQSDIMEDNEINSILTSATDEDLEVLEKLSLSRSEIDE